MDFFNRFRYLNLNSVLLDPQFEYRVEVFFKVIIVDDRLDKVKYHPIRVEFQVSRSPHINSFLWVLDTAVLAKDNFDEYRQIID